MNYKTNVIWDTSLVELWVTGSDAKTRAAGVADLVISAVKITTGAPANTAGKFIPAAIVHNAISGINYENAGTTASPNFVAMATGAGGITQLTGDVTAGPGSGSQVATIAALAVTNAKISATAAIAFSKLAALPSGDILVGSAGNVATAVAMSGDITMTNAGVTAIGAGKVLTAMIANNAVDGTKIALTSQATGSIMYYNGTDWVILAAGTVGQVLTMAGGLPSWV